MKTGCLLFLVVFYGVTAKAVFSNNLPYKILVFSKTAAFRHVSIPNGVATIQQLGVENNFQVVATEDASIFNDASLAQYRAVVFLLTTGDVLDATQQAAFERYIRAGHGYVGVHSASDTEYTWPWYGALVGSYFSNHPAIQNATVRVEDDTHSSTRFLAGPWVRNDEWYNFQTNPRTNVHVLAVLDEASYTGGTMGDHPIAWYQDYDGGRAWYTAGGHTAASYAEPLFRAHLLGGIQYAAGVFAAPPSEAIVLFDGKDMAQWVRSSGSGAVAWTVGDGLLTVVPGSGSIRTFQTFDDLQLHVEFRFLSNSPPATPEGSLANSGVFLQEQFEVQILESYNRVLGGANDGGAIWSIRDASTNASLPGGTWETYDITFRAARWAGGAKTENARVTVCWNGVLVQNDVEISRPTPGGAPPEQPPPGGIQLQDLVGPVQFRNIWVVPLNQPRPAGPRSMTLVPAGATWKYLDDGSNQGTAWRGLSFNDSGWSNGVAQFGYGDSDVVTLIRSNRTDSTFIATTYFRKAFVVTNAWALTNVTVGLLRDDGGIVFLNGTEIFRSNLTNGPVSYTNFALTAVGGADESTFFTTNVNPALLVDGTNLLAVEIHQSSAASSDVSFDLRLTGLVFGTPAIRLTRAGDQLRLAWPALPDGFVLESSPDLLSGASWSVETNAPTVVTNGYRRVTGGIGAGSRFYRLNRK